MLSQLINSMGQTHDEKEGIEGWFNIVAVLSFVASPIVLMQQAYGWLKEGEWVSKSILYYFYESWAWANYPTDWKGIHKILDFIPLFVGLFVLGFVLLFIGSFIEDIKEKYFKSRTPIN